MNRTALFLAALSFTITPAFAQSNIGPQTKYAWAENCGWLNFRDAGSPSTSQGVTIASTHLRGFAWGENVGYINFGQGPLNTVAYSNTTGADFGVNIDAAGNLNGFAWGENIGWINFAAGALASPPRPARFDAVLKRLRGYAWGENIGWINLDDSTNYVGTSCLADFNKDGVVNVLDLFDYLNAWFNDEPAADVNGSGNTAQDIFDFLNAWFAGC